MGAGSCLWPPLLSPLVTHQENHTEKTGKEKEMRGSVQEQPVSPRTEAHTSVPGPYAAASAAPAPAPAPVQPGAPRATPTSRAARQQARDSRRAPPPSHPRPAPRPLPTWAVRRRGLGRWPRPCRNWDPRARSLLCDLRAPVGLLCLNLSPNIQRQKKTFLKGRRFHPIPPKAHINSGLHIELSG